MTTANNGTGPESEPSVSRVYDRVLMTVAALGIVGVAAGGMYVVADIATEGRRVGAAAERAIADKGFPVDDVYTNVGMDELFGGFPSAQIHVGQCVVNAGVGYRVTDPGRLWVDPARVDVSGFRAYDRQAGLVVEFTNPDQAAQLPMFSGCFPSGGSSATTSPR